MKHTGVRSTLALLMLLLVFPLAAGAQLMIIGNDEKVTWDDAGKVVLMGPGKDTVSVVDISMPESPRIVSNLPLINSVFGPPVNLAITPDGRLAIVANSVTVPGRETESGCPSPVSGSHRGRKIPE